MQKFSIFGLPPPCFIATLLHALRALTVFDFPTLVHSYFFQNTSLLSVMDKVEAPKTDQVPKTDQA